MVHKGHVNTNLTLATFYMKESNSAHQGILVHLSVLNYDVKKTLKKLNNSTSLRNALYWNCNRHLQTSKVLLKC